MTQDEFIFSDARAIVTGAASGMGQELALQLAALGSRLILLDRDASRLAEVAAAIELEHGPTVLSTHTVDLASSDQIADFLAELDQAHDGIDLLINNAGVSLGGRFLDVSDEEFEWVQAINFRAPVALTRGVLPLMAAGAHIVNVSSLFGLVAPAGQTAYSASKFALRGFSEGLRRELVNEGVGVTTVHPGGVRTRIAESVRIAAAVPAEEAAAGRASFARMLSYPADRAAAEIIDGVRRRQARVVITSEAKLVDAVARLIPVSHLEVVQDAQRRIRRIARAISNLKPQQSRKPGTEHKEARP